LFIDSGSRRNSASVITLRRAATAIARDVNPRGRGGPSATYRSESESVSASRATSVTACRLDADTDTDSDSDADLRSARRGACRERGAAAERATREGAGVGQSKRERHRLKRARKKASAARQSAQRDAQWARRDRAVQAAMTAERLLQDGDAAAAVEAAARAVALWPRDQAIAGLYVDASQRARDTGARIRAYEHLLGLIEPDPKLLILLADCHAAQGNASAGRDAARRARAALPGRLAGRRRWLALLDSVERRLGTPAADSVPERQSELLLPSPAPMRPALAPAPAPPATLGEPPAAPARLSIPIAVEPVIGGLERLGRSEWDTLEAVALGTLATRVRHAESFDTLLAAERAQGLLHLSHQEETARKVLAVLLGRALLADEVGLGKTIEAGLVLSEYLLRGRVERALVLAPPSLVRQWVVELAAKFGITCRSTEDPDARRDPARFWSAPGVVVASLPTARSARQRAVVATAAWDLIIVDEAHGLKNARTQSHSLVASLTSRFLLLLTATPVENDVEELYNLVSLLRPGHLGGRAEFVRRFGGRAGRRPSEAARRELATLLGEVMVRNTRALSGVRLPPRFARTLLVSPGAAEADLYGHLLAALRAIGTAGRNRLLLSTLLQEAGSSPAAVRATLGRLAAAPDLGEEVRQALAPAIAFADRVAETGKAHALWRLIEGDGPVIVFTRFRATQRFLGELLARRHIACERLAGDVAMPERHAAIERLRERGGVLLSTDVGSEGLNLQFCHRLINFDLPWNPMRIEQRIGRLHRIGQEQPVEVVNLCVAGSIEERILRILDERINLFELVVGEVEMILGYLDEDGDFPTLILEAFANGDEAGRERALAALADALAAARSRYQHVKAYDEVLFRNELGV
jgi:hypothetical protein